jgi:hypothetical protein
MSRHLSVIAIVGIVLSVGLQGLALIGMGSVGAALALAWMAIFVFLTALFKSVVWRVEHRGVSLRQSWRAVTVPLRTIIVCSILFGVAVRSVTPGFAGECWTCIHVSAGATLTFGIALYVSEIRSPTSQ